MLDAVSVNLGDQLLQVGELPKLLPQEICLVLPFDQIVHGILPVYDFLQASQRGDQPPFQESAAETRPAMVNIVEERALETPGACLDYL